MKKIYFYTPTLLSYIDLMSMGGSEKADDDTRYGNFNSGLKYSIALFLRNSVDLSVTVLDGNTTYYSFDSYTKNCDQTGKEKELIRITRSVGLEEIGVIETGFSVKLGVDWELWMGLREIYSNMVDEEGYYSEQYNESFSYGTVVELSFEEESPFFEVWQNRHLYINETLPLFEISSKVEALENPEGWLRIYKQNILVYQDKDRPSKFAYNIRFGEIDERRILSNVYGVESEIISAIKYTSNKEFLQQIITSDFETAEDEFLSTQTSYGNATDLIHDIAAEVYQQHGQVQSYNWLIESIKRRKDCRIGGKIIQSIQDSLFTYSSPVRVETVPQTVSEPDIEVEEVVYESSFSAEIKKHYNFKLDVEVKIAKLKGRKVVADKHEKCLIIDENFDIKEDFSWFIIEYIDLINTGNIVENLGNYIVNLLKR